MKNVQDISYFKYGELCFTEFSISLSYMRGVYNYMGKYVVKRGGGYLAKQGTEKILYYLPLTKSLKDYSSYERTTDYQGSTEQSFDENKGLFLYNNTLTLDNSFL